MKISTILFTATLLLPLAQVNALAEVSTESEKAKLLKLEDELAKRVVGQTEAITAISDAGLTKQTLYEVEKHQFTRSTYERAMESLNAVNGEIEALVQAAWGRGNGA